MAERVELHVLKGPPESQPVIRVARKDSDRTHNSSRRSLRYSGREGCAPGHWLPILRWTRRYSRVDLLADMIAGVTLGLTMIPQSIAYATIAGLPSQYGLYAALVGSVVYAFLGTVKEVSIGPTSLMALLTYQYAANHPPQYVVVLACTAGIVELLMGAARLGFLICLISEPVTSAFTSATALIIIGTQLRNLLGVPKPVGAMAEGGILPTLLDVSRRYTEATVPDSSVGFVCILLLVILQQLPKLVPASTQRWHRCSRLLWYVALARNAIAVLGSALLSYWIDGGSNTGSAVPWQLSGRVESGIPSFQLPIQDIVVGNTTVSFFDIVTDLGSGPVLVPLVAILANVAIGKAFSSGQPVDATQEMIALGLCNIIGSCFRSMPTTGAFTRSAVSHASGVRTPLSGLYSALLCLLALGILTPYFYYIPRATLAAVLIAAVSPMLDPGILAKLWRAGFRYDLLAWCCCFALCLVAGIEIGLLGGMVISLVQPLANFVWLRVECQTVHEHDQRFSYRLIRVEHGLLYPGVDRLRSLVLQQVHLDGTTDLPIVLDCCRMTLMDFTACRALDNLSKEVHRLGGSLLLRNVPPRWHERLVLHETEHGLAFGSQS
ncbi:sodium-independent sulfate anion transporter-like isoform X1 [Anopheles aquasalis]|uniref:sodium-independent sulfate anion transporter-like isoform X1 n=1 Tax=Anopheles aquasalis TaxID=42839 RepID=UPI00215AAC79|nr:sodium-independent sulfate anion transporter-like isoform X1 [Anopheles aquasalis]